MFFWGGGGVIPKCTLCFRSFPLTPDLLTVVSDMIARAFTRSGAIRAVGLAISKAFDMV